MIPDDIKILLEATLTKTKLKNANWNKTARESEFKLILQNGVITIDNWHIEGKDVIDFAIYNRDGNKVKYYIADKSEEGDDYKKLTELYEEVNRSYFKTEETIHGIYNELMSDKNVGMKDNDNDELF